MAAGSVTSTEKEQQQQKQQQQLLVSLGGKLDCSNDSDNDNSDNDNHNHNSDENKPRLILASQSPRRREILAMMGLREGREFLVEPSPLDESELQNELLSNNNKNINNKNQTQLTPIEYNLRLAQAKAHALAEAHRTTSNNNNTSNKVTYYLGSDTIVELDEAILEKPNDRDDAKRMLALLSGRQHRVHTAVALYRLGASVANNDDGENDTDTARTVSLVESFVDTASVSFATLTNEDIDAYVASGEPMDKAGSYGIQGIGGQFVERIEGDFFTVMGLPMHKTSGLVSRALQAEAGGLW